MANLLSADALSRSLSLPDLTDPVNGSHALQLLQDIRRALASQWRCQQQIVRTSPVVSVENNYDRLGYPPDGAAREARYTRYVTPRYILRTQTSAAIPDLLAGLSIDPPQDLLLLLPGLVYRRDSIDRLHCGEPHQLDLWRVVSSDTGQTMALSDLMEMISIIMQVALPGLRWRTVESPHPYTEQGVQIDALWHDQWVEVGECGLASTRVLQQAGLSDHSGLAMGLGLDRLLMLRKNIPDIRLLRSQDPRVLKQMTDLEPYVPVSSMPAVQRDLSICVNSEMDEETLGDRVRGHQQCAEYIEEISVKAEAPYADLPASAHRRMGMRPQQKNVLLRVTLRHRDLTLTDQQANEIRNDIYRLLHQGDRHELAHNG